MKLEERIRNKLGYIEAVGQTRQMTEPRGEDLSSNDYLGLAKDQRIKEAVIEGVRRYGAGSTASRLLRGHRDVFEQVESEFARFKGTARSLYFATGYQANLAALGTFLEPEDTVFSDELNHASLIDGIRLSKASKQIFRHTDPKDLREKISAINTGGEKFLVTESLFSMDGDVAPLDEYAAICRETGTNLIVDEAHAVGVFGSKGSGLIEEFGIGSDMFLSVNTAGKALGVAGAFVAGPRWAIDYLVQRSRSFIFTTAPPPALAFALIRSLAIVEMEEERRARLASICKRFNALLRENGLAAPQMATQIVPIVIGGSRETVDAAARLQDLGLDIRAIRPPTVPEGTARLRISLNTGISDEVLVKVAGILGEMTGKGASAAI